MRKSKSQPDIKGAEEARKQLPALIAAAAAGRITVITRHGRAVAAMVSADSISASRSQAPLTSIAGTGKGLWGKQSARLIARLRDEWNR